MYIFQGLDACASMEQFDHYEMISTELVLNDKNYMEERTGCLYPCEYTEYRVKEKLLETELQITQQKTKLPAAIYC